MWRDEPKLNSQSWKIQKSNWLSKSLALIHLLKQENVGDWNGWTLALALVIPYNPNWGAKICWLMVREVRSNRFLWKTLWNSLEPFHLHFSLPFKSLKFVINHNQDTTIDGPDSTFLYSKILSRLARGHSPMSHRTAAILPGRISSLTSYWKVQIFCEASIIFRNSSFLFTTCGLQYK